MADLAASLKARRLGGSSSDMGSKAPPPLSALLLKKIAHGCQLGADSVGAIVAAADAAAPPASAFTGGHV